VGYSIFTKVLEQVMTQEVPRSNVANLIILIILNDEIFPIFSLISHFLKKNTLPSCKNLPPPKRTLQGTSQRIIYKHPRDIQTMLI
jgi:hypothetical protein